MALGLASAELLSLAPSEEHVAGQTMASMPRGASPECSISLLTVPAQDWATAQLVAVPWGVVPAAQVAGVGMAALLQTEGALVSNPD
jgi:hypothetical protein